MKEVAHAFLWRVLVITAVAISTAGCATIFAPSDSQGPADRTLNDERAADQDALAPEGPPWRVVASGMQAAVRVPVARRIADPGTWIDAWAALHANKSDPPARPEVDFWSETAVIILLGQRPTGGYEVSVVDIDLSRDPAHIKIDVTVPAAGSVVSQALTTPYLIVAIPGPDRDVEITGDEITTGYVGE